MVPKWICFCFVLLWCVLHLGSCEAYEYSLSNVTICSRNGTNLETVAAGALLGPLATVVLSNWFLTLSALIDAVTLTVLAYYLYDGSLFLSLFYDVLGTICIGLFAYRLYINCKAWRFAKTRHTNFILGKKGEVIPNKSHVIPVLPSGALYYEPTVTLDRVVLRGSEAEKVSSQKAEVWQ